MQSYHEVLLSQILNKNLTNFDLDIDNSTQKEEILVVDDTSANLKLISDFLGESGFKVRIAKSGIQALKLLERASPDLILLDIMMPEMDGFETCRRLKSWEKTKDIPVIFMTAIADFANPENKVKGLTLGAVDYITKPIQLEEILARVKIHLHLRSLTKQLQEQNAILQEEIRNKEAAAKHRQQAEAKLIASEAKLATAQRVAHVGNWEFDALTKELTWSEELFRIFGLDPSQPEPTYKQNIQQIYPDDRALWQKKVRRALQQGQSYNFDFRIVRPNGQVRHIEGRGEGIVNEQGQVIKLFGTALDITDRKQAEMLLAGQNHILELIASDVPLSEILDTLARFVEQQSGKMRCSFLLLDPEERLRFGAAPSLPQSYNHAIDGVAIGPEVGSCGTAAYSKATVIVSDIATDPLWASGRDLALSYGLRACWSTPILSAQGTVLGTFAGYYDQPQRPTQLDQDLIAQTLYLAKIAIERERSQQELRQSEAREREKAQELEQTLGELKRTQTQLIQTEKMSSLGRMVAGITHEINNPISFIYGNLTPAKEYFKDLTQLIEIYEKTYPNSTPEIQQLIEEIDLEFLMEDWSKLMHSMQVGAERIEQTVLSLKSFSRLDESALKPIDIHENLDNTLLILQHRLRAEGNRPEIQVIKDYSQLPLLYCYASQLNQVFMNLFDNAIDALEHQSESRLITIKTAMESGEWRVENEEESTSTSSVVIRVTDNGKGMDEEVLQHIFDPFFTTKAVGKGTGLGLAISHQIVVEKHKGHISCLSTPGQKTEFIVEIPVNLNIHENP
ncbi:response regulator [Allocoleopsis sp.]|uniref:response regulator n=1 Tax=Allocoleopsis sp. TaxID=3088169 RepID=UPI002FD3D12E